MPGGAAVDQPRARGHYPDAEPVRELIAGNRRNEQKRKPMADYYPLISRAVAGLEKNNGENRRALYERAREALLTQLRSVTPALNESDITRERLALEESIRKVEAEAARKFVEPSREPPAPKIRPLASRPAEPRQTEKTTEPSPSPPPRRSVNPPAAASPRESTRLDGGRRPSPPPALPPQARRPEREDEAATTPEPQSAAPSRHPLRRPMGERRSWSDKGLNDLRKVVSEANELGEAPARAEKSAREAYAAVASPADLERPEPAHDFDTAERMFDPHAPHERMFPAEAEPRPHQDFSEPMLEPSFALEDSRPVQAKPRRLPPPPTDDDAEAERAGAPVRAVRLRELISRDLLIGLAATALVVILGAAAVWQWPNMVAAYRSMRTPAVQAAREPAPSTSRPKFADRIEPGAQQGQGSAALSTASPPSAAVAQKVVLYEEDPADPNGKRFVGSAIWHTETVTPGPGQSPELAVRADIEVPERKLTVTWSLRRNTDKSLPATHTIEIMFKLPEDFPAGGISNVPGILMKQAEQTRGVPLAGLAVKVTPGFYLIGLSNLDTDKDRNIALLKERSWFDIPVVYNNNRRAILAMEKGTPGERAFADAFKVWKQ
jgi:hypothetical protein